MKINIKISILTTLLVLGVVWSCDQSVLDKTNPNELSPETFFEREEQLRDATNAIYASLQTQGLYVRQYFFSNDLMSQECIGLGSLGADLREYINHSWITTNGNIQAAWNNYYRGINKANFVIANADRVPASAISDAKRAQYLGEAQFLRAYNYFELVTRWGAVPIYSEPVVTPSGNPRSPVEDVYQLILTDLANAADNLPPAYGADELGRATAGAAHALKGKVHLFREEWTEAIDEFEEVEALGYELTDDYFDNFTSEDEHNIESIFEVQFSRDYGGAGAWGSDGSGVSETTFRSQEYGFNDWRNVIPSEDLLNEFEPGDPRYDFSFYIVGDLFNNDQDTIKFVEGAEDNNVADARPNWRKYQRQYKSFQSQTNSEINFRVLRYADVLLMWAEALNESGSTALAVDKLNEVRSRPSVNMPLYGTAAMNLAGYPVATQADVRAAVIHERMVELAGEQKRYMDMQRWGIAQDIVPNYEVGKHELWPIPQAEIDANEAILPTDQNPGY